LGHLNNIKNQASDGHANSNHASWKIGISISSLLLYICCIAFISFLLSGVSRYLFNHTPAGQKIHESAFHLIFVSSSIKSLLHTAVPILQPQALNVFDIENNSIQSRSL